MDEFIKKLEKGFFRTFWNYTQTKDGIEFSRKISTDLDENFSFEISGKNPKEIAKKVNDYCENFDPEKYVEMKLEAKQNGDKNVPGLFDLVDDAKSIKRILQDLASSITEIEQSSKKFTIKEIKEMDYEEFGNMLTDDQYNKIKELGFTYVWEILEKMQDGAELSELDDNEEYTTIEEYIEYLEDKENNEEEDDEEEM